jgi:hypothetical protein
MHRCQRLARPSKQFCNWFYELALRAAVVLFLMSSMSSKCLPFNISFIFENRKSHWGVDPVNRKGVPAQLFSIAKNCFTYIVVLAGALS